MPNVHFAAPAVKHACPNSAACWSPAMPVIGTPSGSPGTPRVLPKIPADGSTRGSTAGGTRKRAHRSSAHAIVCRSNSSVRDALLGSVACTAPPVRRCSRNVSIVPNASSPRSARARSPPWSSSHASLVAEKYGSIGRPVRARTASAWPSATRRAHTSAVRRSCHTIARCTGTPVARSHSTVVSRWLVRPRAAIDCGGTFAIDSACCSAVSTEFHRSAGSCSTRPGAG